MEPATDMSCRTRALISSFVSLRAVGLRPSSRLELPCGPATISAIQVATMEMSASWSLAYPRASRSQPSLIVQQLTARLGIVPGVDLSPPCSSSWRSR